MNDPSVKNKGGRIKKIDEMINRIDNRKNERTMSKAAVSVDR